MTKYSIDKSESHFSTQHLGDIPPLTGEYQANDIKQNCSDDSGNNRLSPIEFLIACNDLFQFLFCLNMIEPNRKTDDHYSLILINISF